MPLEPIPRPCFDGLVKPYLEYFYNEHQEEIDNKKMDDICHLDPKPKAGILLLKENEQDEEYALLLEEEQHRQKFNAALFQKAQENDPILKFVKIMEQGAWVKHNGILYIRRPGVEQNELMAIVVPQILQRPILDHYHGTFEGPHFGRKKLYMTLKRYFWWRGMARHVADYCSQCIRCKYETPKLGPKVQYQRKYKPQHPNEIISIDIVGPYPKSNLGRQYVLTIQCEFSKYVCAIPLKDKTASGVTRAVTKRWILVFGNPKCIRSDEGTDTDSAIIQYLCQMKQIKKIQTPIYSPHANPVEQFHQTMNQAL